MKSFEELDKYYGSYNDNGYVTNRKTGWIFASTEVCTGRVFKIESDESFFTDSVKTNNKIRKDAIAQVRLITEEKAHYFKIRTGEDIAVVILESLAEEAQGEGDSMTVKCFMRVGFFRTSECKKAKLQKIT